MAEKNISPVTIENKMKNAYLNYSLSVIVGRALPDVRDGLKPVHRRILYACRELGLTHDKPHKKSARIVGEVLGKYHPHGDAAVYDAMVRMAQYFNQRYLLIDGHGNFGSIDGDSPAAMRYTEARLTAFSQELLKDIDQETVKFRDNFDGSLSEPTVLPSRIPNLLVNGSSGIAVGMSTSITPHNLTEVIDALNYLTKHPGTKIETLINNHISGPDFPTGGKIIGKENIIKAYKTGKGKVTLRGVTSVEKSGNKKKLIIKEIPYQVNKAKLIEEIANLVKKEKIKNINDVRDETDKEGLRIVIELKKKVDPAIITNRLYKFSSLQKNYRINLLALVDNQPEVMNLKTILNHFLDFRRKVITKRTRHLLNKTKDRHHILQGLIKAISNLDQVIQIIRNSQSTKKARQNLIDKLEISEEQAKAILQMQLQRLVKMEIMKLEEEIEELENKIEKYQEILNNKSRLDQVLKKELKEIKKEYGDQRKTEIIDNEQQAKITKKDLIKEKKAVISYSYKKKIKRTDNQENIRAGKNDHIIEICKGRSLDKLLFFNSSGSFYSLPVHELSEHHGLSTGEDLSEYLQLPLNENIVKIMCLNRNIKNKFITIATADGLVKKTEGSEYETNYTKIKAIKLNKNDRVISVQPTDGNQVILLGTFKGQSIRFKENEISPTGRNTIGKKGIDLKEGDRVINMNLVNDNYVVSISKDGKGNKSLINDFSLQKRYGKGLKTTTASDYLLAGVITAGEDDSLLMVSSANKLYLKQIKEITTTERPGYMYNVVKLDKDEEINKVLKLPKLADEKKDNNKNKEQKKEKKKPKNIQTRIPQE